jgi:hypothetical protein
MIGCKIGPIAPSLFYPRCVTKYPESPSRSRNILGQMGGRENAKKKASPVVAGEAEKAG